MEGISNREKSIIDKERRRTSHSPTTSSSVKFCEKTKFISLSHNNLSGTIPIIVNNCLNLEGFDISFNSLIGELPPQICEIPTLAYLSVRNNMLTGSIEEQVRNCQTLELLEDLKRGYVASNSKDDPAKGAASFTSHVITFDLTLFLQNPFQITLQTPNHLLETLDFFLRQLINLRANNRHQPLLNHLLETLDFTNESMKTHNSLFKQQSIE
ncbi:hypothetical protein L1887_24380 [Cichorium endivia]|nr:hypothetical protein L1887_24380 [Cichorium endivia]